MLALQRRVFRRVIARVRGRGRVYLGKFGEISTTEYQEKLIGSGVGSGEFEEGYGDFYGEGSGVFLPDYDFLFLADGDGSGTADLDFDAPFAANGNGSGIIDEELLAALAELAAYILNLDTKRTYQFDTYEFDGIGRFNNKLIGVRGNKIYDLETAATLDDSTAISAYFDIETDLSLSHQKAFRAIYAEDDAMTITITDKEGNVVAANLTASQFRGLPRTLKSQSFTIRFANISGQQVTFRRAQARMDILQQRGN